MKGSQLRFSNRTADKIILVIVSVLVLMVVLAGSFVVTHQQRLLHVMVVDSLRAAEQVVESKLFGKAGAGLRHFAGSCCSA